MKTDYEGIDYSGIGSKDNRDPETGIRYGIISANSLQGEFWESVESVYDPHCPHCGTELSENWDDGDEQSCIEGREAEWDSTDVCCPSCLKVIEDGEQYGDEPSAQVLDEDGIKGFVSSDNDVWITKSPFFTYAQFCSPCAPGACHLDSPLDETGDWGRLGFEKQNASNRCYCLPADWFEDNKLPYTIHNVE